MRPIVYDLCAGLGGWTEGFLAEGWRCIGYDIEAHEYGDHRYPGELRLKSILDLHGSELADADCIVASPPCQEFSYMAMPWKRGKVIAAALRGSGAFPEGYTGSRTIAELRALFDACFRIQREAGAAAGRYIPLVLENVKGAQPWVGMAKANYGSFYLWGDIETVNGNIVCGGIGFNAAILRPPSRGAQKFNLDGTTHPQGSWFAIADSKNRGAKAPGQDWSRFEKTGEVSPDWKFQGWNSVPGVKCHGQKHGEEYAMTRGPVSAGVKIGGSGDAYWRKPLEAKRREATAIKNGGDWFGGNGKDSFGWEKSSPMRNCSSKSSSRKAASALIAKIPFELSSHIARCYYPKVEAIA